MWVTFTSTDIHFFIMLLTLYCHITYFLKINECQVISSVILAFNIKIKLIKLDWSSRGCLFMWLQGISFTENNLNDSLVIVAPHLRMDCIPVEYFHWSISWKTIFFILWEGATINKCHRLNCLYAHRNNCHNVKNWALLIFRMF